MKLLWLIVLLLMTSCTMTYPLYEAPYNLGSECPQGDVGCLIDLIDEAAKTYPCGNIIVFAEGYYPENLREMYDSGKLTVEDLSLLTAFATGMFGYAHILPGEYGGVASCEVHTTWDGENIAATHELMHCLGCFESGYVPAFGQNDYTPKQKEIMKKENVTKWADTQFYREGTK